MWDESVISMKILNKNIINKCIPTKQLVLKLIKNVTYQRNLNFIVE